MFPIIKESSILKNIYSKHPKASRFVFATIQEFNEKYLGKCFIRTIALMENLENVSGTKTYKIKRKIDVQKNVLPEHLKTADSILFEISERVLGLILQTPNNIPFDAKTVKIGETGEIPPNLLIHNIPGGLTICSVDIGPTDGMISLPSAMFTLYRTAPNSEILASPFYEYIEKDMLITYPTTYEWTYSGGVADVPGFCIRFIEIATETPNDIKSVKFVINDIETILTPENFEHFKIIAGFDTPNIIIPLSSTSKNLIPDWVATHSDKITIEISTERPLKLITHHINFLRFSQGIVYPVFSD